MRAALACIALTAVGGCVIPSGGSRTRPARLELEAEEGRWRVSLTQGAELAGRGWRLRIVESEVSRHLTLPHLYTLVADVVNTSSAEPLLVPADAVLIRGFTRDAHLGPGGNVTLEPGESIRLTYDPGLRAPELPHPFKLTAIVRPGGADGAAEQISVTLH